MNFKIRVKALNRVFSVGSELDARLARVAVLYEDLRLENLAIGEESIERLDGNGAEFRRTYFLRRSIATVNEFAEALEMLDSYPEFRDLKAQFTAAHARSWAKSVGFFRRRGRRLRDFRNDFGGHFGYPPAWYAMNNLNDGAVVLEYASNPARRSGNVRLKFAGEIVAIGMRRHSNVPGVADHFRSMMRLAVAGFGHSVRCSQILADEVLWGRFGA